MFFYKRYLIPTKQEETQKTKRTGVVACCVIKGPVLHYDIKSIAHSGYSIAIKKLLFFFALSPCHVDELFLRIKNLNPGYPQRTPGV